MGAHEEVGEEEERGVDDADADTDSHVVNIIGERTAAALFPVFNIFTLTSRLSFEQASMSSSSSSSSSSRSINRGLSVCMRAVAVHADAASSDVDDA